MKNRCTLKIRRPAYLQTEKFLVLRYLCVCVCVRGKMSLETVCLILAYKMKHPENIFMLRGNHESASINRYI